MADVNVNWDKQLLSSRSIVLVQVSFVYMPEFSFGLTLYIYVMIIESLLVTLMPRTGMAI